ncbi:MAG: hypothetical protein Q8R30_02285 [bacterium]|nr:hypothetical protein [bacterium]
MSTIQDQIAWNKQGIDEVVASASGRVIHDEEHDQAVEQAPVEEFNSADIDALLGNLMQLRVAMVASDDEEAMLLKQRQEFLAAEAHLRKFYTELPALADLLAQKRADLVEAEKIGFAAEVSIRRGRVETLVKALAAANQQFAALKARYPDLKQKIEAEEENLLRHREFLVRFAKGDDPYVATTTLNPLYTPSARALAFLAGCVRDARSQGLIAPVKSDAALFTDHEGHGWSPVSTIPEGREVCIALSRYYQEVLARQAEEYVNAGLLLSPDMVAEQKKDPQNRHTVAGLIRAKSGFCFVTINPRPHESNVRYRNVTMPEMRVEYVTDARNKAHGVRVTAVTTPCVVDDFFAVSKTEHRRPAYYFDDPNDFSRWTQINPTVKASLVAAVRRGEAVQRERAVIEKLSNAGRLGDKARLIDELADGVKGVAVILVANLEQHAPLAMEIVSDGIILTAGLATRRSEGTDFFAALSKGRPVSEFLARHSDGAYANPHFQELYVANERKELERMASVLARRYDAAQVSRANANIKSLAMPVSEGGENGTYLFFTSVQDEKRGSKSVYRRDVGYVARRENDKIIVVNGITAYSRHRFLQQKFMFDVPYAIAEVRGFLLYMLQKVYGAVMETSYNDLPDHLKSAKAKAHAASSLPDTTADNDVVSA